MGITFESNKEKGLVLGKRSLVEATEHLNSAIDILMATEDEYSKYGLVVKKNFVAGIIDDIEKIRDRISRA